MTDSSTGNKSGNTHPFNNKYFPPELGKNLVLRRSLLEKVNAIYFQKLVLVHAAAGFGKSVLLKQFWDEKKDGNPVAWLNLEAGDSEPDIFLSRICNSVRYAGISADTSNGKFQSRNTSADIFLRYLFSEIESISGDVVIIIDNYENIDNDKIENIFEQLLGNMPDNLHLIIAGRHTDNLNTTELYATDQMSGIRGNELAFTDVEVAEYFGDGPGKDAQDEIQAISEGWPYALHAIKNILSKDDTVNASLNNISGATPEIAEFIEQEIISGLTNTEKDILIQSSILGKINYRMVNAILDRNDSWTIITQLTRLNNLIVPLEEKNWCRFQKLFGEYLFEESKSIDLSKITQLHKAAARWYFENDKVIDSVKHATLAGDEEYVKHLLDTGNFTRMVVTQGTHNIREVIKYYPKEKYLSAPRFSCAYLSMLFKDGRLREGLSYLKEVITNAYTYLEDDDYQYKSELKKELLIAKLLAEGLADCNLFTQTEMDILIMLEESAPKKESWFKNSLNNCIFFIKYYKDGDLNNAIDRAEDCIEQNRIDDNIYGMIFTELHLGIFLVARGDMDQAAEIYQDSECLIHQYYSKDINLLSLLNVFKAEISYERNEIDQALALLDSALPVLEEAEAWINAYGTAYRLKTKIVFHQYGLNEALAVIQSGITIAAVRKLPRLNYILTILKIRLLLQTGDIASAGREVSNIRTDYPGLFDKNNNYYGWHEELEFHVIFARYCIYNNQPDKALEILEELAITLEKRNYRYRLAQISILKGLAYYELDEKEYAAKYILDALNAGLIRNYIRIFLDEGVRIKKLLKFIVYYTGLTDMSDALTEYISLLLTAHSGIWDSTRKNFTMAIFTDREKEVLCYLAPGMSNKRIGKKLNMSDNTVKYHLKNIYKKLGIGNRRIVQSIAKDLDLVDLNEYKLP